MINTKDIFIDGEKSEYTVDTIGRIYSKFSKNYLKPYVNTSGYYLVDLYHKKRRHTMQVHRIVAIAFIPNPELLPTVNHKNGNKANNTAENLEWMTRLDNVRHAWITGLAKPRYGTDNPANKYTEEQIHAVCSYIEMDILTNREIATACGVNITLIRDIKFRGKWKHISSMYDLSNSRKTYKFLMYEPEIYKMIKDGFANKEILDKLCEKDDPQRYSFKRCIERCKAKYKRSLNDYPGNGGTSTS